MCVVCRRDFVAPLRSFKTVRVPLLVPLLVPLAPWRPGALCRGTLSLFFFILLINKWIMMFISFHFIILFSLTLFFSLSSLHKIFRQGSDYFKCSAKNTRIEVKFSRESGGLMKWNEMNFIIHCSLFIIGFSEKMCVCVSLSLSLVFLCRIQRTLVQVYPLQTNKIVENESVNFLPSFLPDVHLFFFFLAGCS